MKQLFYFNPDNEMSVGNGSRYYTPPTNIVKMSNDLAYLPAYFSKKGDAVLLKHRPDKHFMIMQKELFGLELALFYEEEMACIGDYTPEPWGVSPRYHYLFRNIEQRTWQEWQKELYSRKTAQKCLEHLSRKWDFIDKEIIPLVCTSMHELQRLMEKAPLIIKAPWSSSGKGQLRLPEKRLSRKEEEWVNGILTRQGYIMVEKWLDKKIDFAMQFYSGEKEKITFLGYSVFETGETGNYQGNHVCSQEIMRKRLAEYISQEQIERLKEEITTFLEEFIVDKYAGHLGVDMMIYRDCSGKDRIHPCVEINLRYNMGILASFLYDRFFAPDTEHFFSISYFPQRGKALETDRANKEKFPLKMVQGKIVSGYINLTPVTDTTNFIAMVNGMPYSAFNALS